MLIAAAGVLAIGWVLSAYAREVPAAGSLYDYVSRRHGTPFGAMIATDIPGRLTGKRS